MPDAQLCPVECVLFGGAIGYPSVSRMEQGFLEQRSPLARCCPSVELSIERRRSVGVRLRDGDERRYRCVGCPKTTPSSLEP